MNTLMKLLIILLMMNIFIYIGINFSIASDESTQLNPDMKFYWRGDLIEKFMASSLDDMTINAKDNWTDYNFEVNESFSNFLEKKGGSRIGVGGISLLDNLDIVWSYFKLLWNVAFAPLAFFMNFRVPVFVGLIIGVPMVILYITTIVLAIRGVGD